MSSIKKDPAFYTAVEMHYALRNRRAPLLFRTTTHQPMSANKDQFFLAADDYSDFVVTNILHSRTSNGYNTKHQELSLLIPSKKEFNHFIGSNVYELIIDGIEPQVIQFNDASGMVIWADCPKNGSIYFRYYLGSNTCTLNMYGTDQSNSELTDFLTTTYATSSTTIEWIYNADGQSISVPVRDDRFPVKEMYAFLEEESLEDYYDRFMSSSASILLLIGPPGTGKTSFIRGLLQHTKSDAIVTYDSGVLARDRIFASFVEGEKNVFVMEDADTLLAARKDGNEMMHKFLNIGDGLVTTQGKKMIFSTNLPSIADVDPALVRPGRCFDVLNFKNLPAEKAKTLCVKLGIAYPTVEKTEYSLAEVFHTQTNPAVKSSRKMGFV